MKSIAMDVPVAHLRTFVQAGQLPIWVNTAVTPAGQSYADLTEKWHSHDFTELIIVKRGTATHCTRIGTKPVQGGDVRIVTDGEEHCFERRKGLVLVNIMYAPDQLPLPLARLRSLPGYSALFEHKAAPGLIGDLHLDDKMLSNVMSSLESISLAQREKAEGTDVRLCGYLMQLMVEFAKRYANTDIRDPQAMARLSSLIGEMESNPAFNWTIDGLAAKEHLSRNHFMRLFQLATGHSAIAHLMHLRMRNAKRLLLESTDSVTEISYKTGFSDSNYFTRQFRRIVGCTPSNWRKSGKV